MGLPLLAGPVQVSTASWFASGATTFIVRRAGGQGESNALGADGTLVPTMSGVKVNVYEAPLVSPVIVALGRR